MGLEIFKVDQLNDLLDKQRADIDLIKKESEIMNQTKITNYSGGGAFRPS